MSLLLDALKKAADDKQKASQGGSAESISLDAAPSEVDSTAKITADLTAEATVSPSTMDVQQSEVEPAMQMSDDNAGEKLSETVTEITEELTLDSIEANTSEDAATVEKIESAPKVDSTKEDKAKGETDELSLKQDKKFKDSGAPSYTVSDEALSMLIYKTNRDVKQSKRLVLISVLLVSLVILISGGVYYYTDMQAEIAILERKHQIAMQSMELKTNKEKTPGKSEIIRNLTSESDLDDKVQYAKKHMAEERGSQQIKHRPAATLKSNNKTSAVSPAVSFQKTNKADPVAEKLEQAWTAYEGAQYDRAKILYKDVLIIEENNRDALLGLGAIAVIEKNDVVARKTYILLLKHDPRDPIAIAALASLRNSEVSTEADEKYLLNMLQRNPDDAHLNFALGNIYAQQNKWKSAQQSYFSAWQRDNENADYIFNLAVSMDQLGKQKQAVDFYRDCLSKSGNRQVGFSREAVQKRITELSGL